MKKLLLLTVIFLFSIPTFAQFQDYPRPGNGELSGGLGLNWIDGDLYYTFHFTPEISFANFGVGLDLRLDINSKGGLREENFNEFSDYLSVIRYIRYGVKNDPVYARIGALDYYTLGHGSIMYAYNNSPSYDSRKIGAALDIDFGEFGFESMYGQFGEAGVMGLRGYVRPLRFTELKNIPIISNLEIGASYAGDFNKYAGVVGGFYNQTQDEVVATQDVGSINIVGVDIGLPILQTKILGIDLYADYAKILDFGSGISTGIQFQIEGLGLLSATAKLERRFNNDQYLPSYFNSVYELQRFNVDTSAGTIMSKAGRLEAMTNSDNGIYGSLGIDVLGLFNIYGSYQRLDKTPNSGTLHLVTQISPEEAQFLARAGYDKTNIGNETAIFKVDENSYFFAEVGYKPVEYIIVSLVYSWTFTPIRGEDDNIIDYKPIKRIEPRVSFVYPFDF